MGFVMALAFGLKVEPLGRPMGRFAPGVVEGRGGLKGFGGIFDSGWRDVELRRVRKRMCRTSGAEICYSRDFRGCSTTRLLT